MKTKIKLCIVILLIFSCLMTFSGCSTIKYWYNPGSISSKNIVWINEEYNIWLVIDDESMSYYGILRNNEQIYYIKYDNINSTILFLFHKDLNDLFKMEGDYEIVSSSYYWAKKMVLTVSRSNFPQIPKGTKLVFKPYPRQAEHYLPK